MLKIFHNFFFSFIIGKKKNTQDKSPALDQAPEKSLVLLGAPLFLHQPAQPMRCRPNTSQTWRQLWKAVHRSGPALTSAQHREEQQAEGGREVSLWGREVSASLAPPEKWRDIRFPSCSLPSSLAFLPSSPGPDNPAHFHGFQQWHRSSI